jgi:hypothetical protein
MVREELGYGEEVSLVGEGGKLLYDVDFEDLLEQKVGEVGLSEGRTLIVMDEEGDRVNVEFIINEGDIFTHPELGRIPSKPPPQEKPEEEEEAEAEKVAVTNGVENGVGQGKKRLREEEEMDMEFRKKARVGVEDNSSSQDIIVIDDDDTIMID